MRIEDPNRLKNGAHEEFSDNRHDKPEQAEATSHNQRYFECLDTPSKDSMIEKEAWKFDECDAEVVDNVHV